MDREALVRDLSRQVQETIRLHALGSGGKRPGQLEFKTLSGACLRVSVGEKKSPYGPLDCGYEPRDYGYAGQEELREAVRGILLEQGLRYAGHREGEGPFISWLTHMREGLF